MKAGIEIDHQSGVPLYRQIIEQVEASIAAGGLRTGDQLPTVRQLAVQLSVNPNTVIRADRELEIRGILETQQGSGTFVGSPRPGIEERDRQRVLNRMVTELLARASRYGITLDDVLEALQLQKEGS